MAMVSNDNMPIVSFIDLAQNDVRGGSSLKGLEYVCYGPLVLVFQYFFFSSSRTVTLGNKTNALYSSDLILINVSYIHHFRILVRILFQKGQWLSCHHYHPIPVTRFSCLHFVQCWWWCLIEDTVHHLRNSANNNGTAAEDANGTDEEAKRVLQFNPSTDTYSHYLLCFTFLQLADSEWVGKDSPPAIYCLLPLWCCSYFYTLPGLLVLLCL